MEIRERKNAGDILNTLVNIFDSKEVFVKEFQTFLANRLLARMSYDDDEEVEFLEMLKLRFGESSMQHCEVMLKDVGGSKRVNNLVQAEAKVWRNGCADSNRSLTLLLALPLERIPSTHLFSPIFSGLQYVHKGSSCQRPWQSIYEWSFLFVLRHHSGIHSLTDTLLPTSAALRQSNDLASSSGFTI